MNDLEKARSLLASHSLCLVKGDEVIIDDRSGISPLMSFIEQNKDLNGFSAADKVVGKAAAFLMIKCGIKAVYASVLSRPAYELLVSYRKELQYSTLTEKIINREGTGICPMEKEVLSATSPQEAYSFLKIKLEKINR